MIGLLLLLSAPAALQGDTILRDHDLVIYGPASFLRTARTAALRCRYEHIKTIPSKRRSIRSREARITYQGNCLSRWAADRSIPFVAPEALIISEN